MGKYILLRGDHDGFDEKGNRKRFKEGDIVELNEKQAKAFADKFQSFAENQAAKKVAKEIADIRRAAEEEENEVRDAAAAKALRDAEKEHASARPAGTRPAANSAEPKNPAPKDPIPNPNTPTPKDPAPKNPAA